MTILMVEQNARRALAMSDRGYVLDLGQNRFEGAGRELLDDPKVAELPGRRGLSHSHGREAASGESRAEPKT